MKLGVLGDIHGNIEALKAVHETAILYKTDKMYHLGDVGGYAPFVNEVVDFLVEHGIEGVQGNYDDAVGNNREHCGCRYENPLQEEMAALSFEWTKKHASWKSKEYMRSLPFEIVFSCDGRTVKMFHATPLKNNLYWHQDRKDRFFLEMADKAKGDILIYGHTHIPYRRDMAGKVFINAGSVGKPKDGDARACLTLIECLPEGVRTDFIRVPYNIEKVVSAIIEAALPAHFAENLREGK